MGFNTKEIDQVSLLHVFILTFEEIRFNSHYRPTVPNKTEESYMGVTKQQLGKAIV